MNIEEIKAYYRSALDKLEKVKEEVAQIRAAILYHYQNEINAALAAKKEPFGTINIDDVKFNVAKNVKWEQEGLKGLYGIIAASGDNPDDFIEVSMNVSETKYKAWPESIKSKFEPLRKATEGAITVKLK